MRLSALRFDVDEAKLPNGDNLNLLCIMPTTVTLHTPTFSSNRFKI